MAMTIQNADALMQRLIKNSSQVKHDPKIATDGVAGKLSSDRVEISDAAHQARASSVEPNHADNSLESQLIKLSYGRNGKIS